MAFNPAHFADDTDFERFVLERLGTHRARPPEPGSIHDIRGGGPASISIMVGSAIAGEGRVQELLRSLRPLGFGAAYKVLDMLVEHVLRANNAPSGRLTFARKKHALAKRPAVLPVPLDRYTGIWDRLAVLYGVYDEGRHAVTHRRAVVNTSGDLEVYDDQRVLIDTVTSAEIEAFAAAVHTAAELVIDATPDIRRGAFAATYLNVLHNRHQLGAIPAAGPETPHRLLRMDLEECGDGRLRFNVARAKAVVDGQEPSFWDLELHWSGRVFVGRWDDVPDWSAASFDLDAAMLPVWLSEEIPSTG